MKCPICSKDITNDMKFCTNCGTELHSVRCNQCVTSLNTHQKFCPKCGGVLNPEKKFCEKCGTPNNFYSRLNTSYQIFSQSLSQQSIDRLSSQQVEPVALNTQSESNSPTPNAETVGSYKMYTTASEEDQIVFNEEKEFQSEDQKLSDDLISGELPVDEDLDNDSSSGRWKLNILVIVVLAICMLLLGQRLNWWNMEFLSWVNGNASQNAVSVNTSILEETLSPKDEITEETHETVEEAAVVCEPYIVHLTGTIGGKYPIELILDGERKGDGFYLTSGKYRYTKYGDSWIKLHGVTERVENAISYLKILEYSDDDLTGTWNVHYNLRDNSLKGYMTNGKGDSYEVSVSESVELKDGYYKITGDVVTESEKFPFYIDFKYDKGTIRDAEYHNIKYSASVNLPVARLTNNEYYFEGIINSKSLKIRFSSEAPYKGTLDDGSSVQKIEMNI